MAIIGKVLFDNESIGYSCFTMPHSSVLRFGDRVKSGSVERERVKLSKTNLDATYDGEIWAIGDINLVAGSFIQVYWEGYLMRRSISSRMTRRSLVSSLLAFRRS